MGEINKDLEILVLDSARTLILLQATFRLEIKIIKTPAFFRMTAASLSMKMMLITGY